MGKLSKVVFLFLLLWIAVCTVPMEAFAQGTNNNTSNTCISNAQYQSAMNAGTNIIQSVFTTINNILSQIAANFYTGIVQNQTFQDAVGALILMYVTIYGVLIMFNLASVRTGEMVVRLVKIGIVWFLISANGYTNFSNYIGNLFMGGMNELIGQFEQVAGNGATVTAVAAGQTPQLDTNAVSALTGPMNQVFTTEFMVAILSLFTTGIFGPLLAIGLAFSLVEFIFMIIGALATYVKSVIGLTFLFGVAPIFIAFILFEKTRQIFLGWLNQVVAFSLQPVLLFGFLAFYTTLLTNVLSVMLPMSNGVANSSQLDFCWLHWFSVPLVWDVSFWRPVVNGAQNAGDWIDSSSKNPLPPPPSFSSMNVLYFMLLCSLGKNFADYIGQITSELSQGIGPGIIRGSQFSNMISNQFAGGRGPAGIAAQGIGGFGSFLRSSLGMGPTQAASNTGPGTMPRPPTGTG